MSFIGNLFGTTTPVKKVVWIGLIDANNRLRDNNEQTEMHVSSTKEELLKILKERIQFRDDADVDENAILDSLGKAGFADKDDFKYSKFNYHIYEKEFV